MFRTLLRLIVVLVILAGVGAFLLGWWGSPTLLFGVDRPGSTVGTTGRVDTDKAKAVGAEVGAKTAEAANRAGELLSDAALTGKIKSKMALDDWCRPGPSTSSTTNHVVTLSGKVRSVAEHDRAVQLAKETREFPVVDRLEVIR
jgi:hypothetical protein